MRQGKLQNLSRMGELKSDQSANDEESLSYQFTTLFIRICPFSTGELLTTAQWIRKFVEVHPEYKQDSVVSESICYDLMNTFDRITRGELGAPQLFGKPTSKTSDVLLKKCLEIKEEMKKIEAEK